MGPGRDPAGGAGARSRAARPGLDTYFGRIHRYALALRPLMSAALADEETTLDEVLPRAIEVWQQVLEEAGAGRVEEPTSG